MQPGHPCPRVLLLFVPKASAWGGGLAAQQPPRSCASGVGGQVGGAGSWEGLHRCPCGSQEQGKGSCWASAVPGTPGLPSVAPERGYALPRGRVPVQLGKSSGQSPQGQPPPRTLCSGWGTSRVQGAAGPVQRRPGHRGPALPGPAAPAAGAGPGAPAGATAGRRRAQRPA